MYISTRSNEKLTASQAIIKGLASDGGLFIPDSDIIASINDFMGLNYQDTARKIFSLFLDDFTQEEIDYCVESAYNLKNFNEKFLDIKSFENSLFMELYHGPTLAFKDMALTILPFLVEVAKKKQGVNEKSLILVATSGDTGGAALSSFSQNRAFDTVVLYPNGGVSEIQEKQMLYYTNDRTKAFAVDGNFDDCQTFVKKVFSSYPKNNGVILSSANSINIGRLIPQVVYYVYGYCQSVKSGCLKDGEQFDICVPTGNFGDIFAGYLAKVLGVPIRKLICASNVNNVLTDFFRSGVYDKNREFKKSNSPAMDILISSNLERLVYLAVGRDGERVLKLQSDLSVSGKYQLTSQEMEFLKDFDCAYSTEEETISNIKKVFDKFGYLIDPHTAVAYDCYEKVGDKNVKTLIVSTASPYKFPYTVAGALNIDKDKSEFLLIEDIAKYTNTKIPFGISKLKNSRKTTIVKTKEQIQDIVTYKNMKVEVKVPCSTANLGCAYDCAGLALGLYNTYEFEKSSVDELVGFKKGWENNLVLSSYKKVFEVLNKEYVPVKLTLKRCNVPSSRGLGSSANCIVAGVVGANYMLKNILTKEQMLKIMTDIEGHPDNVAPSYLGGMTICASVGDKIECVKVSVNSKLKFFALIPNFELATKKARAVLPTELSYADAISNMARASMLSEGFRLGNLQIIKTAFDDKMHQPYRFPLINGASGIKKILEENGYAVALSGAGPTLLAVGYKKIDKKLLSDEVFNSWRIKELKPDLQGVLSYVKE